MTATPTTSAESDPFFQLLTDALRAGRGSPQWGEAVEPWPGSVSDVAIHADALDQQTYAGAGQSSQLIGDGRYGLLICLLNRRIGG